MGGAGFIGTNLVQRLLDDGEDVVVFDNLSRPGVERNLDFLQQRYGRRLHTVLSDIRDTNAVEDTVRDAKAVFHFAAQVAVTSSLVDPMQDFAINAQGTLTILDAIRRLSPETPLVFASTNKVYGALDDIGTGEYAGRYLPVDATLREFGIDEGRKLDFCTPYGCSKGAADQYVLDYAHSFGLKTAVLRMSCIYGPHQFGTEDQGWVAHFLIRAMRGEPITIYGDGKQVRDILHVERRSCRLSRGTGRDRPGQRPRLQPRRRAGECGEPARRAGRDCSPHRPPGASADAKAGAPATSSTSSPTRAA